jgi:hypothetical protein
VQEAWQDLNRLNLELQREILKHQNTQKALQKERSTAASDFRLLNSNDLHQRC